MLRYCKITHKDPVQSLQRIRTNALSGFFDWLLKTLRDTIQGAGTVQTYWNTLCIIRSRSTAGVQLDPLIKQQMIGVCPEALQTGLVGG